MLCHVCIYSFLTSVGYSRAVNKILFYSILFACGLHVCSFFLVAVFCFFVFVVFFFFFFFCCCCCFLLLFIKFVYIFIYDLDGP